MLLHKDDPLAVAAVAAIRSGDLESLRRQLDANPGLAAARIFDDERGAPGSGRNSWTLLHAATDWPGHFPSGPESAKALVAAGADVNGRFAGRHRETPLHWAASCDDVAVLDALLDLGADIEADGAVVAGGTPLDDAVAFGMWYAARRLVERGAKTALWHAAALGLMDLVERHFTKAPLEARHPWRGGSARPRDEVTIALWCACHGGERAAAGYLLSRGAELNWVSPWDGLTPLDAAERRGAGELVRWLRRQGAKSAREMPAR